jgi:hypothetical protein
MERIDQRVALVGELVRVYVLGEKEGIDKGTVFASLVLDRLFDGFSVLFILLATLFMFVTMAVKAAPEALTITPVISTASAARSQRLALALEALNRTCAKWR